MPNILYTLIIFPIEQLIELCYAFALRLTHSPGLSVIGLSMIVSTLILPIYLMAEEKQKLERERQKQMKGKIDKIKAVFKGDERYMLTSTLYRQNNYHPIYALSNSLDLFIQIPFFIAAYHFLHNLDLLNGQKFKFLIDLGASDGLLGGINLLPVLMTAINCVSGAIYAKGLHLKDKIQLYGTALVFLVLLYNSPSALVLYWTCNNIYNLVKNIVLKNEKLKKYIYPAVILLICLLIFYILLFSYEIGRYRRFIIAFSVLLIILSQYRKQIINYISKINILKNITLENTGLIFAFSVIGIFLLVGLVIPSSLIASSVEEFSFIKPFSSPIPFIGITLLQSAGILLWLVCIYFLFKKHVRQIITFILTVALGIFIINVFCFKPNYGFMTLDLLFSYFHSVPKVEMLFNIFVILFTIVLISLLLLIKKNKIFLVLQSVIVISLLCFGIMNIYSTSKFFKKINNRETKLLNNYYNFYTFTKTGKNVLIIMVDYGISEYVPYIFDEKHELLDSFKGFVYYPNTISFGSHTIHGMPGILGGYYYTPYNIHNRINKTWFEEYAEALQTLPIIFADSNYKIRLTNQSGMDDSYYKEYNNIIADKSYDKFSGAYFSQFKNQIPTKDFNKILYYTLLRYSLFKISPYILHNIIYDNGKYLLLNDFKLDTSYSYYTLDSYAFLYYLPDITSITDENENYFTFFMSELTCTAAFMEVPDYKPSLNLDYKGNGPFASEKSYHSMMSTFLLLGKWFNFFKENGIYDNTRIIIVSDHGRKIKSFYNDKNIMPDDDSLIKYNSLLLIKDFNVEFDLTTDNKFMTNADVPHIAADGLINTLINPFTGYKMLVEKSNGVTITSNDEFQHNKLLKGSIKPNEWLHVKDNIFDPANWSKVTVKE